MQWQAPLEDMLFSLDEIAGAHRLDDWDRSLVSEIAEHFAAFMHDRVAPLDARGDLQGCRLENGRVTMPDGFCDAYADYVSQGWPSLTAPPEFGGQGLGNVAHALVSELFSAACHSLQMVTGLVPGCMRVLQRYGTAEQQQRYFPALVDGRCLSTMALTEPGAGSDLSRIRTRAEQHNDGWRLSGEKIFISGGDQNLSERILHLVLARTSDGGLSLFACPSHLDEGELGGERRGERNRIGVQRIEEKMGLHASPTCHLVFDDAYAELLGEAGKGLEAMFTMMNYARVDVALQGVAHAAKCSTLAADYAAQRVQGRRADGEDAVLADHADVRRMLDDMQQRVLGARAMAHTVLVMLDAGDDPRLVEFMTPVIKVFCTEAGIGVADTAIQVMGGYGYLQEYAVEQSFRDCRITSIYEGANGIHALALAARGLRDPGGADAFAAYIDTICSDCASDVLQQALSRWQSARSCVESAPGKAELAHHFLQLTANLWFLGVWERLGARADQSPDSALYRRLSERVRRYTPIDIEACAARLQVAESGL